MGTELDNINDENEEENEECFVDLELVEYINKNPALKNVLQSMARQIGYAIRSDNDIEARTMSLQLVIENFILLGIKDDGKLTIL